MKPEPAPHIPGKTEFERFDNAMRKILSVSKQDAMKAEAKTSQKSKIKAGRPKH